MVGIRGRAGREGGQADRFMFDVLANHYEIISVVKRVHVFHPSLIIGEDLIPSKEMVFFEKLILVDTVLKMDYKEIGDNMELFTIGYENLDIEKFFSILLLKDIELLIDIRELPISRKPGFSKNKLIGYCDKYKILYLHEQSLGCPKPIRHDFRKDKDWERYTLRYSAYLATQIGSVSNISRIIRSSRCCLMCFEEDYYRCHRSIVSKFIVRNDIPDLFIDDLRCPSVRLAENYHAADKSIQRLTIDIGTYDLCLKEGASSSY